MRDIDYSIVVEKNSQGTRMLIVRNLNTGNIGCWTGESTIAQWLRWFNDGRGNTGYASRSEMFRKFCEAFPSIMVDDYRDGPERNQLYIFPSDTLYYMLVTYEDDETFTIKTIKQESYSTFKVDIQNNNY